MGSNYQMKPNRKQIEAEATEMSQFYNTGYDDLPDCARCKHPHLTPGMDCDHPGCICPRLFFRKEHMKTSSTQDVPLQRAIMIIKRKAQSWYDFCAERGHIPDNVQFMPSVQLDFSEWLQNGNQTPG